MTQFVVTRWVELDGPNVLTLNDSIEAENAKAALEAWLDARPSFFIDHLVIDEGSDRFVWADFYGTYTQGELSVHPGVAGLSSPA